MTPTESRLFYSTEYSDIASMLTIIQGLRLSVDTNFYSIAMHNFLVFLSLECKLYLNKERQQSFKKI